MMAEKTDRRIRKTKAQLRRGLAKLLKEKTIKEITVKEPGGKLISIALHFIFIIRISHDLLEQTENDLKNEILEIVNNDQRLRMEETMPYITELFVFIADNREIASALLGPHGDVAFMRQIEQIILSHCMKYLKPYLEQLDERTLESVNGFCIAGCIGLIISWMKHDFEDTPESMARMTYTLVLSALKPYMQSIAE